MSTRTSSWPYYIYKYFLCPEKSLLSKALYYGQHSSTESGGGIFCCGTFANCLSCRPGSLTWAVWPCGRYIDPLGGAACCHFLPGAASATTGSCPQPPQIQQPANSSTQWFQIIPRWSRCRWNHTHIECNVSHWHLQKSGLFRPQTAPRYPARSSTQSWEERGW